MEALHDVLLIVEGRGTRLASPDDDEEGDDEEGDDEEGATAPLRPRRRDCSRCRAGNRLPRGLPGGSYGR
ncbi:hypothetical protein [Streptomyces sp. NPDC048638]|uniref:hypothetical protein n=1 Tax=Streptomyces sp. NPDC048638 TaxID=3365580 RepID=UPI00371F14A3